jgi:hypothetical protein
MSYTQDGWFNDSYIKVFTGVLNVDFSDVTPGLFKGALFTDSVTPDQSQIGPAYGTAPWTAGAPTETAGPGYTEGGFDLTVTSFAEIAGTANKIGWKFGVIELTNTTITAESILIYIPTAADLAVLFRWFGQAYPTSDGDFQITGPTDGYWREKLRAEP